MGNGDVAGIVDWIPVDRASIEAKRAKLQGSTARGILPSLSAIDRNAWRDLADRAVEPNAYYLPDWELAVNATARDRTGASALAAWQGVNDGSSLIGLMPVT